VEENYHFQVILKNTADLVECSSEQMSSTDSAKSNYPV